jgi:hypothetical protein
VKKCPFVVTKDLMCWDMQVARVHCSMLRWKSKVDLSSKGQRSFVYREEKGKVTWGTCSRTWKPVVSGSDWKSGFIAFLLPEGRDFGMNRCLLESRDVSLVQTDISWEGEGAFSPLANSHLLRTCGPPAVCSSSGLK